MIKNFKRIFVVGLGKGSALATLSLARILDSKLTRAISLDVVKPKLGFRESYLKRFKWKMEFFVGSHLLPSEENIKGTKKIIELAKNLKNKDGCFLI